MKNFTLLFLFLCFNPLLFSQTTAVYDVVFNSIWNEADHGTFPNNPHWSKLVGVNHNANITFLELGGIASQGIEDVAELGINDAFESEVQTSITNGDAQQYIDGDQLATATGNIEVLGLQISEDYPLLTLVSMIAPSPDWMIAVNGVNLRASGTWEDSIVIDLYVYDAGTDSGMNYSSPNADITPHVPITSLSGVAPFNTEKVGTLTITLQQVLGVNDIETTNHIQLFPNPATSVVQISTETTSLSKVVFYDVLGKKVKSYKNTSNSKQLYIDINSLTTGVYLVKSIANDGSSNIQRLLVK
ncbi:spondin domain-containing protein [Meridianimaribacter flavus]|uniref:Secreted protein (Por secretion system target) n=1 Tax=Meridianimaribacter flavus TaxID=571115 RepID=A0ABY2G1E1_9FLAO|nr:spondin domain-containing protein [Meridianimaribacter flavus]TDY05783.1 putative secreted protein (Por secretion system target) [Meridianimaribacter flavus]